jgi:hypothetical protein
MVGGMYKEIFINFSGRKAAPKVAALIYIFIKILYIVTIEKPLEVPIYNINNYSLLLI